MRPKLFTRLRALGGRAVRRAYLVVMGYGYGNGYYEGHFSLEVYSQHGGDAETTSIAAT